MYFLHTIHIQFVNMLTEELKNMIKGIAVVSRVQMDMVVLLHVILTIKRLK